MGACLKQEGVTLFPVFILVQKKALSSFNLLVSEKLVLCNSAALNYFWPPSACTKLILP